MWSKEANTGKNRQTVQQQTGMVLDVQLMLEVDNVLILLHGGDDGVTTACKSDCVTIRRLERSCISRHWAAADSFSAALRVCSFIHQNLRYRLLVPTLPTIHLSSWVTSLDAVYQTTCSSQKTREHTSMCLRRLNSLKRRPSDCRHCDDPSVSFMLCFTGR